MKINEKIYEKQMSKKASNYNTVLIFNCFNFQVITFIITWLYLSGWVK